LPDTESVAEQPSRGLDHGAYVPLTVMYPEADVPVLQISMPTLDPTRLLELGRRLRPLRDDSVLIMGSGFLTHGLPFLRMQSPGQPAPGWSADFDAWAAEALARGAVDELADFRRRAPAARYAHPTVEHFAPMFVTLGAADDAEAKPDVAIEGFWYGLSKRSFQVN
jgi:4,5-DOPA dioxygenase extradiol